MLVPVLALALLVGVAISDIARSEARTVNTSFTVQDPICTIKDPELAAVSGMATRSDGTWVANDRTAVLYRLNDTCKVAETVDLGPQLEDLKVEPNDIEDLSNGPDGWLWLADVGGNRQKRSEVQLIGWRDAQSDVQIVTLQYPKGTHDVEAVAIDMIGRAVLVTKETDGAPATVFRTPLPVASNLEQTLEAMGTVTLKKPQDSGPGSRVITGAAMAPSGTFVVLRTYANAWEFDAPDGDLAAALTRGNPRLVLLPVSEQGEAIAYTGDGRGLLATGEQLPVALDFVRLIRSS